MPSLCFFSNREDRRLLRKGRVGFVAGLLLGTLLVGHRGSFGQAQSAAPPAAAVENPAVPTQAPSAASTQNLAAAQDAKVWGGLVYASNEANGGDAAGDPKEFPKMAARLGKIFPYSQFRLIGQHAQVVFREYESWVVPSREVFLKLDSKGPAEGGGINLHVQFWQGQQVLVKTDAVLREGKPLVIGGPKWRDGQVIFLLNLQKVESARRR